VTSRVTAPGPCAQGEGLGESDRSVNFLCREMTWTRKYGLDDSIAEQGCDLRADRAETRHLVVPQALIKIGVSEFPPFERGGVVTVEVPRSISAIDHPSNPTEVMPREPVLDGEAVREMVCICEQCLIVTSQHRIDPFPLIVVADAPPAVGLNEPSRVLRFPGARETSDQQDVGGRIHGTTRRIRAAGDTLRR
jgi:hypothetical protein